MRTRGAFSLVLLCGFLFGGVVRAQVSTGTISGTAKDSSGGLLPGVKVVIQNEDTGISRTLETDSDGHYSAPSLSLGNYQVTGSRDGFQTEVRTGIVLTVAQEAVVDLALTVGSVTQTVKVTGGAPLVETTTASLGSLVDAHTIRALPLNGRSYDQLALLQPGVVLTSPGQTGGSPYAFGTGKRFTVGGQRSISNSFLLDNTNVNDQANGTPGGAAGTNLGVDTIQEFKIFTNSFNAEFGHSSGSVITAVTRSGTNNFHGTAFEYLRNSVFDARNYFDPASGPPTFRRNQFGGVVGGPIKKDKAFFFVGYEGLRQALATTQTAIVPTALAREGMLPGGVIVPVNPDIVPYLNLYPMPSPNGIDFGDGTAQFLSDPTVPTNEDNVMARVDYQLNAKTTLFGRYMFDTDSVNAQQSLPNYFIYQATRRQYATIQATTLLGTKAVNSFRFAYNRTHSVFEPTISPAVPPALELIPGQPLGNVLPGSGLTGLGSQAGNGNRLWAFNVWEWGDDFSYNTGKHSLKVGTDIQRLDDNTTSAQTVRGQLSFPNFTAFLKGLPNNEQATGPVGVIPQWGLRQSLFAVYAQDDYKVLPRLTLNLGLRWETATDPTDATNRLSMLPSLSAPAMVPSETLFSIGKKNFEPRVGLAWQLTGSGKTVLRSAFGIYHDQILPWAYQLELINPPYFLKFSATNPPFPNGWTVLKPGTTLAVTPFSPFVKTPVVYQYNLSIQQEIARRTVFQIAYAGSQGRQLETQSEADTFTPTFINGNRATPFYPVGAPRLNPAFNSIQQLLFNANSSYNSVTASVRMENTRGFQGQLAYTYAKSTDDHSNISASDSVRSPQDVLNPFDIHMDYGLSDYDVRNAVVGNFVYQLPSRATSRALGLLVNGWAVNGIATYQSGMPFTARLVASTPGVSRDGALNNAERPSLKPGASDNPTRGVSAGCPGFAAGTPVGNAKHWYDPCAFIVPVAGTYGTLGRNTVIGPGLASVDLALAKSFVMTETAEATFRFEVFNVMNHANFGLPSTSALNANGNAVGSAGLISYTLTPSRQLQFAVRFTF
jgi:Carboxypeptidase regulatory-like domain/TonB dependent receptor